jgi:tetratricopeptide (TPR) repeat protein
VKPTDRDSQATHFNTSPTREPQQDERSTIALPTLDDIDLDGLKAEEMESIDELMVRYDLDVEPEPALDLALDLDSDSSSRSNSSSGSDSNLKLEDEPETELDSDADDADENDVTEQQAEIAAQLYLTGRRAFESGYYRQAIEHFERAAALSVGASPTGGEIKIWLVLAYHAHGNLEAALALCRKLIHHPHLPTRKQGRSLRAILEAPELAKRPEWFSKIPDLSEIEPSEGEAKKGASGTYKPRPIRPLKEPEIDPATINRRDNQFIWVAIVLTIAILAYLAYIARFG